jgi:hypothetical protein
MWAYEWTGVTRIQPALSELESIEHPDDGMAVLV